MTTTTKPPSKSGVTSFKARPVDRRAIATIKQNLERTTRPYRRFSASDAIRHALRTHPMGRVTLVNSA